MTGRVAAKVALVTGAASGIGRACATLLAEEGARVMLTDVQAELGQQTAQSIVDAGGVAVFAEHDVTQEYEWLKVIDQVKAEFGGLHILVNNAGIGIASSNIVEMSLADWQRQQAVNLDGVFLGIKYGIPVMNDSGGGAIVNLSSVAGLKGSAGLAGYCATKGGVRLLTKAVALECAREGWPVRVNSVHPGIIATPIWDTVDAGKLFAGMNQVDPHELARTSVPTQTAGRAEDIANGVLFLASDDATYITGTELVIDAGLSA